MPARAANFENEGSGHREQEHWWETDRVPRVPANSTTYRVTPRVVPIGHTQAAEMVNAAYKCTKNDNRR